LAPLLLFAPCCCWLPEIFDIIFVAGIPAIAKVSVLAADPAVAVAPTIAVVLKKSDYNYRTVNFFFFWTVDYRTINLGQLSDQEKTIDDQLRVRIQKQLWRVHLRYS
jgi:hypothetical protein